jgi:succinate-acetate transporter protein
MSIVDTTPDRASTVGHRAEPVPDPTPAKPSGWANSGLLCLIAFAVVTCMFSLVNAEGVSSAVVPVIISTGLIFGGTTQLIGGLIQIRTGDTLGGALFATFGAFWIILPAYLEWFSNGVPAAQVGHATGLLLYTFAIVAAMFLLVSFRTTIATALALTNLLATLLLLAAGSYGGHATLTRIGGITGIILAGQALYLAAAEISEYTYGRSVIPVGQLGR